MPHATFQLRGYCSKAGYQRLDDRLASLRFLYNAALQERKEAWEKQRQSISYYDQNKSLTAIRADDPEGYGALYVNAARGVLRRVDLAFNAFFRRVKRGEKPGFPRFKGRYQFQCIDVVDPVAGMVKRTGQRVIIKVKGLPRITLRPKRPLPDSQRLKALRIVCRPTGCTVDLVYEVEKTSLPPCQIAVGIDMGVRKRMTLSTGETIPRVRQDWAKAERLQARRDRCRRGSQTKRKLSAQYRRLRRRMHVQNRNACHRLTTDLVRRFGRIAVEASFVQDVVQTPAHDLNKAIHDQTWGLLRQQLAYKAAWAGREYMEVPRAYTSQDCSRCGARHEPGRKEQYVCPFCGLQIDRDVNAAINILRAGILARAVRQKDVPDPVGAGT